MRKKLDHKKTLNAWAFYDWANSVFPLVITAAIFPAFYENITEQQFGSDKVLFFGQSITNTVLYSYAFSFSFLIIAFLSPVLSGIADYTGNKKAFMRFFVFFGALSCSSLYFFDGSNIEMGIASFILANIGFNGSLVFYNAYLPEIASKEKMDRISAKGYSLGYIGSLILLLINLYLILSADKLGLPGVMPYRISFLSVGVWWIGFSFYTFKHLPVSSIKKNKPENIYTNGLKELYQTWKAVKTNKNRKYFLFSFFAYSMGVQTILYLANLFGSKELNIPTEKLIIAILLIQILGIGGAYLFSFISGKKGNIFSLTASLSIWILICIIAFFVHGASGFYVLAVLVGAVMGGIQSISRSTYSKLIPDNTQDHSSYFSFYEFSEKLAIVIGTWVYGFIEFATGSMRNSIIVLAIFFMFGIFLLRKVSLPK